MMPKAFTVGEVLAVLRTRLDLSREEGLVLFAHEKYMLRPNTKLEEVYERYSDEDGFLYLVYAEENIYGWTATLTFEEDLKESLEVQGAPSHQL